MAQRDEKGKVYRVVGKIENIDSEKRELQTCGAAPRRTRLQSCITRNGAVAYKRISRRSGLKSVHALFFAGSGRLQIQ
jgi:hypothetical protein